MPLKIAPEDRKLAIAFAVMLTIAVALAGYTIVSDNGTGALPSSYSAGNAGTKAAFLLLQETGYNVQRSTIDPRKIADLSPQTTLIMAEPIPTGEEDAEAIRRFVRRGGRVVTTGLGAAAFFKEIRVLPGIPHFEWKTYRPQEPSDLTKGINEIAMAPQFYFSGYTAAETPFRDEDERPIARMAYGAGEVIWWSSTDPMSNAGIREKDNAQLLLNSVGDPVRGPVLWDEYFHQGGKTVVDSILNSPLRWGLVQAGLLGLMVMFTFSRRFGPVRQSAGAPRLAPMEYVETLAALYKRAAASHIAVEIVYERFRAALQRRYSVSREADAAHVAITISEHVRGSDLMSVTDTVQQIEAAINDSMLPENRATALVKQMHDFSTRLNLKLGGE
jgi:hypothetical protein